MTLHHMHKTRTVQGHIEINTAYRLIFAHCLGGFLRPFKHANYVIVSEICSDTVVLCSSIIKTIFAKSYICSDTDYGGQRGKNKTVANIPCIQSSLFNISSQSNHFITRYTHSHIYTYNTIMNMQTIMQQ